jgi:hypothetical protein
MASSFLRFLDHTQRRITVGRTPLDEWSARHRDLYLTTHDTHNRQIPMPPVGLGTHDLSKQAAAYLRLRPRGYWDRQLKNVMSFIWWSKVGDQIKVGPPYLLCNVCEASHRMGRWFAPNSVYRSHGLKGTKRPLIRLLLFCNKHKSDRLKIYTQSETSRFAVYN